jgi:hypothetical protein
MLPVNGIRTLAFWNIVVETYSQAQTHGATNEQKGRVSPIQEEGI